MSTITPVTFNTGSTIAGTTQVGDLAAGTSPQDYSTQPGGLIWWSTPDTEDAYVIAHVNENANQPNPLSVPNVRVGFWKTQFKTEESFIERVEYISLVDGDPQTFTGGTDAKVWLNDNGYWTSYNINITPTPTASAQPTPTPTQTVTNTQTPTITPTNTQTPSITPTNTITPTKTVTPSVTPTNTVTPTKTTTPTNTQTPTKTSTPTPTNLNAQGFSYSNFASTTGLVGVGNTSVSSNIYFLTTAANSQIGNVYRTTAIQYNRNFSAQWSTFIGGGTGADGYCIQWTPTNNTNGATGGGVGYVSTAINAITFLTYVNNSYNWYKNNVLQVATSVSSGFWRQTLYFWGDYNHSAQTFALYYSTTNSKPGSPNKTFTSFSFDTSSYYMGFGAATGGANDNQELLSWSVQFT